MQKTIFEEKKFFKWVVRTAPTWKKKVKSYTISILWLKYWVPFFNVVGDFIIFGGLGGKPIQKNIAGDPHIYV